MFKNDEPILASLSERTPSEVTPLLLELMRQHAARRMPKQLKQQWERDPFVRPSDLDQRTLHKLDGIALDAAEGFEALQLSPVAPLGVCSSIAETSQDRTLSALRGTEVVSDPTNVLALDCASRLQRIPNEPVRLCTVHQTLRTQPFPKRAGYSQHFRLFALAQAGKGLPEDQFECHAFVKSLSVFDRIFDAAEGIGCQLQNRQAQILVGENHAVLGERVYQAISNAFPHVTVNRAPLTHSYYDGLRVLYGAVSPRAGAFIPLGDTGRFDWIAHLTSNRKMRFVASGLGIQLLPILFAQNE